MTTEAKHHQISCDSRLEAFLSRFVTEEEKRRLARIPTRRNEYGFDAFGFRPDAAVLPLLLSRFLYRYYFRTQAFGIEHLPQGRALLVANHSGQLPYDAINIAAAVFFDAEHPRWVRSMLERFVPTLPYVGQLFARWGQVLGTPENCRRLLEEEEMILVFPEGAQGITKSFNRRYQLQPFGKGFMRLAVKTQCPVIPIAVIGAEEQFPALGMQSVADRLHLPAFSLIPFPPFVPVCPLPVRYRLHFGKPLMFDDVSEDDDEHIELAVRQVRLRIESMIQTGLRERHAIFW